MPLGPHHQNSETNPTAKHPMTNPCADASVLPYDPGMDNKQPVKRSDRPRLLHLAISADNGPTFSGFRDANTCGFTRYDWSPKRRG